MLQALQCCRDQGQPISTVLASEAVVTQGGGPADQLAQGSGTLTLTSSARIRHLRFTLQDLCVGQKQAAQASARIPAEEVLGLRCTERLPPRKESHACVS